MSHHAAPPPSGPPRAAPEAIRRVLRVGLRNVSFALRPGVLISVGARARYPLISAAATQVAILVSSIVLARVMGKHVFGQYGMILTIQVIFFTVSNLRLSSILPAFIAPVRDDLPRINRISSTAWLLTLVLSAMGIAAHLALLRTSTSYCEVGGLELPTVLICVPVIAVLPIQYAILAEIQSMERIGIWALASGCVGIMPVLFSLLGSLWFERIGLTGFAVFVGAGSLGATVPVVLMRRWSGLPPLRPAFDRGTAKRLLRGGLSLWTICVLDMAALSLARVLTVRYTDHGEAGCFILAYSFVGYLQMMNGAFVVPLIPNWSRLARKRRRSKLLRELRNAVVGLLLAGAGYGLALYALSPRLVPMIYGVEYEPAIRLLQTLAFTCPIIGLGFAAWSLFIAQGRVKVVFWANVGWAGTLTVASLILIPRHGAIGAAIAVLLAYGFWGTVYLVSTVFMGVEIAAWQLGQPPRRGDSP